MERIKIMDFFNFLRLYNLWNNGHPLTVMVRKVTVMNKEYTNILMGTVQAAIAHGVLDAVRAAVADDPHAGCAAVGYVPKGLLEAYRRSERGPLGVYVHVPFCVSLCPYCDFVVFAGASSSGSRLETTLRPPKAKTSAASPSRTSSFGPSRAISSLVNVAKTLLSRKDSVLPPEIRAATSSASGPKVSGCGALLRGGAVKVGLRVLAPFSVTLGPPVWVQA